MFADRTYHYIIFHIIISYDLFFVGRTTLLAMAKRLGSWKISSMLMWLEIWLNLVNTGARALMSDGYVEQMRAEGGDLLSIFECMFLNLMHVCYQNIYTCYYREMGGCYGLNYQH